MIQQAFTASRRVKQGFTLIELLVVIAIIAILAAILFPVFAQAREKARQSSCASNQKQVSLAIIQYMSDYDGVVPLFRSQDRYVFSYSGGTASYGAYSATGYVTGTYWGVLVQPYMKSFELLACISEANTEAFSTGITHHKMYGTHFGLNADYLYKTINDAQTACLWIYDADPKTGYQSISESEIGSPAGMVMMTDVKEMVLTATSAGAISSYPGGGYVPSPAANAASTLDCCGAFGNIGWGKDDAVETVIAPKNTGASLFAMRHGGLSGGNVSFVDGHVKFMTPGQLAVGTNWKKDGAQASVAINDVPKYLWDRK